MKKLTTKQNLYNQCQNVLDKRLQVIQNSIKDIQNALKTETKSSAGDKHETGTAMLQLQREKIGNQLKNCQEQQQLLQKIKPEIKPKTIVLGSVVYTNKGNYFIAISLGELNSDGTTFFAISPSTPIGKLLFSKTTNDKFQFRNNTFKILNIE